LNISKAFVKYLAARPSVRSARFDHAWVLQLHGEMFADVWTWAGSARSHDLNLGVPYLQIATQLSALIGDLHTWSGFGHPLLTQATWLHHRAVRIHPFENGNGRWARLCANIWLKRHGAPIIAWPDPAFGADSDAREEYLAAIRAADAGDGVALLEMHRRFQVDPG